MNRYEVTFAADGTVQSVAVLAPGEGTDRIIVEARDEAEAQRKAYNLYNQKKQRESRARLHAEGRCKCSRVRDRPGKQLCSVCAARQKAKDANRYPARKEIRQLARKGSSLRPDQRQANAQKQTRLVERHRDRRGEMRIEVLLEVQARWNASTNNAKFTRWLEDQIALCTGERKTA